MKTTWELLNQLRKLGAVMRAEDDRLKYSAPVGSIPLHLKQQMVKHKDHILAIMKEMELQSTSRNIDIVSRAYYEHEQASFAQQRMWFLDQLEGVSESYNLPIAIRITGELNVVALKQAFNEIRRRHHILRTKFVSVDGKVMQEVCDAPDLDIHSIDLEALETEQAEQSALLMLLTEAQFNFDLSKCEMIRVTLIKLAPSHHLMMINMHHIASDGWSKGLLLKELSLLYGAYSQGQISPLEDLSIQYADYSRWQREWLKGPLLESQLEYWANQLEGLPPLLELPTDFSRKSVQSFKGALHSFSISKTVAQQLKTLATDQGVTPYMVLLATFQLLLSRYARQNDIAVGTPIANRTKSEIEKLIGFFVNTIVIRSRIDNEMNFNQLLALVKDTCLGAYSHQDVPFEQVVEKLHPARDLSHSPLYQVMFTLQNAPTANLDLEGLTTSMVELPIEVAKFDLTLTMSEDEQGFHGVIEYCTDLFKARTIVNFASHFEVLLSSLVSKPQLKLAHHQMLNEEQTKQLQFQWNQTSSDFGQDFSIGELFEAQVDRTPNALALYYDGHQLNYQQLDNRANQMAHFLLSAGVKQGDLVAMCLDRQSDTLVAMLAIVKVGAAYMPMDPNYPSQRLEMMLNDTQIKLCLIQNEELEKLAPPSLKMISLQWLQAQLSEFSDARLNIKVSPLQIAYVIYTSGSTGRPKGIAIPHRGVIRLVCNTNFVDLNGDDNIAQASNIAFDAATFEIFGALLHGGKVTGVSRELMLNPQALGDFVAEQGINLMFVTTALFNQFANENPGMFRHFNSFLFGGESIDPDTVNAVLERGGPERLLHVYGPTESTTYSTFHHIKSVPAGAVNLPIGKAIGNTEVYLLDESLALVPIGVKGEIFIGGHGLAQGYLERPDLTAASFIPNPYGPSGSRLYRTGDLGCYKEDGSIDFIDRIDHQVKIRGFRIELGEIEAVLCSHPLVKEAIALMVLDANDTKRIAAYVVADATNKQLALEVQELRGFLQSKLPDYMVPAAFVILDQLPLTANGKVDKRVLPEPDLSQQMSSQYVAPRNDTERQVAKIWSEVLNHPHVGIHDSFFEIGGSSLLLIKVRKDIQIIFDLNVGIVDLFKHPTVNSLAAHIERCMNATAEAGGIISQVSNDAQKRKTAADKRRQQMKKRKRNVRN